MIQPKVSYFVILCIVIFIEITCREAMMLQVKHSMDGSAVGILGEIRSCISMYQISTNSLPTNEEFERMMSAGIDLGDEGRIKLERDTLKKIKVNSDGTGEILCGIAYEQVLYTTFK